MPKLSPLQWLIVALIQVFYGFAVFALTRDYYQRHPLVTAPAPVPAGHGGTPWPAAKAPPAVPTDSAIPESVLEKDPILLAQAGDDRLAARQYGEAIRYYRQALQLKPDDVDIHNGLGLALHYSGNSVEAVRILTQGSSKDPSFQRIWLTLGFVQLQTDRDAASLALKKAVELGADNPVGQEAKRMLGQLDAAR
jgi:predicted Zn-dependent protease